MKFAILFSSVLIVLSCSDKQKSATPVDVAISEEINANNSSLLKDSPIPVYDFDMLEKKLLQKKNDTTYVVNFWATWCKPCVKELPHFEQLGASYSEEKVKVVLVSIDFPEYLNTKVLPFIKKHNLKSEVILLDDGDVNTWIPKVSEQWEGSIPATLIFNKKGKFFYEQPFSYHELEKIVKSIL